jgi:uncharacterized OsmC-like protein
MQFKLRGAGITPAAVEQAIQLAEGKYCCVAATIRPETKITWDYELETAPEAVAGVQ